MVLEQFIMLLFLGAESQRDHGEIGQHEEERAQRKEGGARFAGTEAGYVYSRPANPTTNSVEAKIASLENGEAAMATASSYT